MMPRLRPEIICQFFYAALLWVHGNSQLILCCLIPYLTCACPIPPWSHPSLESNGPRNESITLCIRFNAPIQVTYICISSHYLKLVSGACFPLACAPSLLSTADKVSKFPLLTLCQMQSQFTSLHFSRTKSHCGIF